MAPKDLLYITSAMRKKYLKTKNYSCNHVSWFLTMMSANNEKMNSGKETETIQLLILKIIVSEMKVSLTETNVQLRY